MPPGARRQAGQAHGSDADAGQAGDGVADGGQHPAHLPVAAFIDGQFHFPDPAAVHILLAAQQADVLGGPGHAVVEHDPFPQTRQRVGVRDALHLRPVRLGDMVARMRELEQEVAVVGQEDQPLAVGVETPHGPQHRLAADVHQVRHQPPGVGVRARRNHAARLVEREVVATPGRAHEAAVELDLVRFEVHLRPLLRHDLAVNADSALCDPLLARPPGTDPGGGERFLQSLGHTVSSLRKSSVTGPPARRSP